jgi:riboflavin synthase
MFTGIIGYRGKLAGVEQGSVGGKLTLSCPELAGQVRLGDSLAVDGVCLSLVAEAGASLCFDLSSETMTRTTLGQLPVGRQLNIEKPLAAGDPLGGHLVSGHVDGIGKVMGLRRSGAGGVLSVLGPAELRAYIYDKCSIAVNGISLTVAAQGAAGFEVALIPETMRATNIDLLQSGDRVNLEADTMVKAKIHAARLEAGQGLTVEKLKRAGFA